ncbi:MAG TPA: c-type cytochrome [Anaerolineae bacterium]
MKKILKWSTIAFVVLLSLALLASVVLYSIGMEKLTRSYPNIPVETVSIPTDSGAVARGQHIATIWACTNCHGANLGGTLITHDPIEGTFPILGTIPAPNLTSGKGGIAKSYNESDWVRAIRHGVKPNGRVEIFMYDYSAMSDRDLGDLIAYLKQIPPADSDYPAPSYGPILPIVPAFGIFTPVAEQIDQNAPRQADPVPGATKEYGKYLSALCAQCHGTNLVAPLRGKWKQEDFVRAVQTGVLPNGRQIGPAMPSSIYGEMNDTELAALWLYLQNLPAAQSQR